MGWAFHLLGKTAALSILGNKLSGFVAFLPSLRTLCPHIEQGAVYVSLSSTQVLKAPSHNFYFSPGQKAAVFCSWVCLLCFSDC